MKIVVVVVGGVRGVLEPAVAEYEARAGRYWKLEVVEVEAGAPGRSPSPERVREAEATRIRTRLPEEGDLWILSRKGKPFSSADWARTLGDRALQGGRPLALVIGGAFGVDGALVSQATRRVGFGPATLPHEMARLILMEQLYRAGTILRGEPYHKGGA